jgi:hypothetical protein
MQQHNNQPFNSNFQREESMNYASRTPQINSNFQREESMNYAGRTPQTPSHSAVMDSNGEWYLEMDPNVDHPRRENINPRVSAEVVEEVQYPESVAETDDPVSEDGKVDPEDEKKSALRHRHRLLGTRKCWAKYCWADKTNPDCHSHPLETLSTNRYEFNTRITKFFVYIFFQLINFQLIIHFFIDLK